MVPSRTTSNTGEIIMAYRGGSNTASKGNFTRKAAGTPVAKASDLADQVYFCSIKVGEGEYLTVGNIQKYKDSGRLVLSLNAEAMSKLEANDKGWINGISVRETKF